jgi:hypothetical protein
VTRLLPSTIDDDSADALRYLIATKAREVRMEKLKGL